MLCNKVENEYAIFSDEILITFYIDNIHTTKNKSKRYTIVGKHIIYIRIKFVQLHFHKRLAHTYPFAHRQKTRSFIGH